ncbi:SMI1/KNR4 family protein [Allostreptomyces psammosilenae]|uniref:Knr4/Smi1-like domain-containing protein n=1 Tax=Allostreptomyces psammosilenae TaxID=1892865 RepID=A0A852ZNZ6_9ACTN|nr:SMI1/KNR4 family protein [Allostreptomyces psammosilenae]NYI03425.1 hypothetical protein [Allostreptomyces psammosilenae]
MTTDDKWGPLIGQMILLKQQIAETGAIPTFRYTLPRVAAREEEIAAAEARLGAPLDPGYRTFLTYANGWDAFDVSLRLFGTEDFGQGDAWRLGESYVDTFCSFPENAQYPPTALLPIAVALEDKDLLCAVTAPHEEAGRILWIAGEIVDMFDTFEEYFASMIEYHKEDLQEARSSAGNSPT